MKLWFSKFHKYEQRKQRREFHTPSFDGKPMIYDALRKSKLFLQLRDIEIPTIKNYDWIEPQLLQCLIDEK